MARLRWFEATVVVDNINLPEIEDDDDQRQRDTSKEAECYIQAAAGCKFAIQVRIKEGYSVGNADGLQYNLILDGADKDNFIVLKDGELGAGEFESIHDGARIQVGQRWTYQKFRFSNLAIGDVLAAEGELEPSLEHLGTIKVQFWRFNHKRVSKRLRTSVNDEVDESVAGSLEESSDKDSTETDGDVDESAEESLESASDCSSSQNDCESDGDRAAFRSIPEKSLKGQAIHISTALGKAQACEVPIIYDGYTVDKMPVATFTFKYRTLEALKEMHLVPRTPTPVPFEERPFESLTDAEKMELLMRYKNDAAAAKTTIKQERQERNLEALRSYKRARVEDTSDGEIEAVGARAVKRRAPDPDSEVIELSD